MWVGGLDEQVTEGEEHKPQHTAQLGAGKDSSSLFCLLDCLTCRAAVRAVHQCRPSRSVALRIASAHTSAFYSPRCFSVLAVFRACSASRPSRCVFVMRTWGMPRQAGVNRELDPILPPFSALLPLWPLSLHLTCSAVGWSTHACLVAVCLLLQCLCPCRRTRSRARLSPSRSWSLKLWRMPSTVCACWAT